MNARKSKVMVDSSSREMIVNSGKWPCGKGVQANAGKCTVCKNGFTSGAVVCVGSKQHSLQAVELSQRS